MNIESISDYPEIVGIGASLLDTLMKAERYPKEDTKCPAFETMMQGGRSGCNCSGCSKEIRRENSIHRECWR